MRNFIFLLAFLASPLLMAQDLHVYYNANFRADTQLATTSKPMPGYCQLSPYTNWATF